MLKPEGVVFDSLDSQVADIDIWKVGTEFRTPASEFVYYRTYSKWNEQLQRRETWPETVDRVVNFLKEERGDLVPPKVFKKIKEGMLNFSVLPSMRLVWAAGPAARKTNVAIYNCSFLPVDSIEAFAECLYILCCGTGVGFSVEQKYVERLPAIKKFDISFTPKTCVVGDSKEAWADSVKFLLESLYEGEDLQFDYSQIRPKGAPLKTMGGRASGPEPLAVLHAYIKQVFNAAQGRKLTTLECHDIFNKIAEIVVVGGVRRSSEISLSDLNDESMRHAKVWPFPQHRAMANNSAVYYDKPTAVDFLKEWSALASSGTGERGISNLGATRKSAPKRRKANLIDGFNPCHEIALRSYEFCNLSSIIVRPEDDLDSLLEKTETATWIGVIQSTFTDFSYLRPMWKKNCEEERLLGVSISGQLDNPDLLSIEALKVLKQKSLKVAKRASEKMGVNMPVSITCGKPEGCQTKDTYINTSEGILTLEELGNINGDTWQPLNITVNQERGEKIADKFFVNGFKPTKRIKMSSGSTLEATFNHKYRVLHNGDYVWKPAEDIAVGDVIPYKVGDYNGGKIQELNTELVYHFKSHVLSLPNTLNEDLAYFLGVYFADGSNHEKGIRISWNKTEKDILDNTVAFLQTLGLTCRFLDDADSNRTQLYINSMSFKTFLTNNGLSKQCKYDVKIPLLVRKSPPNILASFVRGYQDGDGCVKHDGTNIVVTVSLAMAKDLQIVGRALGYAVSVRDMPPTEASFGENMRYRVTFLKGRQGDYKMDRKKKPFYQQLDAMGLDTLIPDFVESIEISENHTYDISVPDNNTFVANSYISHNTSSQLVWSGSGAHPWYAPYFYRRYRISGNDPLYRMMRDQGFKFSPENGQTKEDATTWVVAFPVKAPSTAVFRSDVKAIDQLEWYKKVQTNWCEHNQSITVYVHDDEWFDVGNWVYKNWDICIGVSFLPYDGGKYQQAPYEEITKEEYEKALAKFPTLDYSQLAKYEMEDNTEGAKTFACTGDKCEIV